MRDGSNESCERMRRLLTLEPVRLSTAKTQLRASSYLRNAKPRDFPVFSSRTKLMSSTCRVECARDRQTLSDATAQYNATHQSFR
jgi:hypothetical protein